MKLLTPVLCSAVALFTATLFNALPSATAHHAFGSEFDANAPILLKGKIVKIEWINPHTWIHVEIVKPDGTKQVWMVEGGSPGPFRASSTKTAWVISSAKHGSPTIRSAAAWTIPA